MPTVSFTGRACISANSFSPVSRLALQGLNNFTYDMGVSYDSDYLNYNSYLPYLNVRATIRRTYILQITSQGSIRDAISADYAIYNSRLLTYDSFGAYYNNVEPYRTFITRARIASVSTSDFTAQGRVSVTVTPTLSTKGYIVRVTDVQVQANLSQLRTSTFTSKASIVQHYTQTLTIGMRIGTYYSQALQLQAKVLRNEESTIRLRAYISTLASGFASITSRGRIVAASHLYLQASIRNIVTRQLSSRARIQRQISLTMNVRAFVNRRVDFTAQARVLNTYNAEFTAQGTLQVLTLESIATKAYIMVQQSMSMQSRMRRKQFRGIFTKATIFRMITTSVSAQARINSTLRDLTMRGTITRDLFIRARISRQHGWPIPNPDDDEFDTFVDTRLTALARIQGPLRSTQTVQAGATLLWLRNVAFMAKAHVRSAGYISVRGSVIPRVRRASIPLTFTVEEQSRRVSRMVFYVRGAHPTQTVGFKAAIVRSNRTTVAAAFSVASDFSAHLQTLYVEVTRREVQRLTARARIE